MSAPNPGLILAAEEAEKRAEEYRREAVDWINRSATDPRPAMSTDCAYLAAGCMKASHALNALALHLSRMAEGGS